MPYANNGTYTPPDGAENAVAGTIIRSLTWNSIHLDLSTALSAVRQSYLQTASVSTKTSHYTVATVDAAIIFNATITATLTLPSASSFPGRWLNVKTVTSQAVVASATIVQPLIGPSGTLGTTICSATAGKFAALLSDGTNWVVMMGN